jgi:putative membrane protein
MIRLLIKWVVLAFSLWLTIHALNAIDKSLAYWDPKAGAGGALITAAVLALVNMFVLPVLKMLTLPLTCLTLGLFSIVLNALLFWAVSRLTDVYTVNWLGALLGALLVGLINGVLSSVFVPGDDRRR